MSPRRTRVARTSRTRPARRARLLTRRAKLHAARRPRRGVLLLVVLSLLVLFLMVGTAFVITAKQSEKAAKSSMKSSVRLATEAAQADLLDEVLHQIVRDTNNPNSSLRFHSLLGDMYGNDGLKGVITFLPIPPSTQPNPAKFAGASTTTDLGPTVGQMIEFRVGTGPTTGGAVLLRDFYGNTQDANGQPLEFAKVDNAYNGQVLTFLDGPARGVSARIVGFVPPNIFRVMSPKLSNGAQLVAADLANLNGNRVLINGRPFNGTGVGLNRWAAANAPRLNATETIQIDSSQTADVELALMPHSKFAMPTATINLPGAPGSAPFAPLYLPYNLGNWDVSGRGGSDESYDAADFQNVALAAMPATTLTETYINPATLSDLMVALPAALDNANPPPGNPPTSMVIPSWHRPELINHRAYQPPFVNTSQPDLRTSMLAGNAMMLRKVMLRPNWLDHPEFTGSNPEFAAIPAGSAGWGQKLARAVHGPWDVDNDNDGIRDSVWIDVGLPVMAGPNGKLVKPLVAMLIVDMDGRLNVNAHGTCDLAQAWTGTGLLGIASNGIAYNQTLTAGVTSNATPRGMGMGPAEISLRFAVDPAYFQKLLRGETFSIAGNDVFFPGRYGHPDGTGLVRPGYGNEVDVMSQVGMNGMPPMNNANPVNPNLRLSSFAGSLPDMRARYGVGVNDYGLPIFDATLNANGTTAVSDDMVADSPYELNLSQNTAAGVHSKTATSVPSDAAFSTAELERLLRVFDVDSGTLPPRLAYLSGVQTPNGGAGPQFFSRLELTSDSYDLPIPGVAFPAELQNLAVPNQNLISTDPNLRRQPATPAEVLETRIRWVNNLPLFPEPLTPADAQRVRGIVRQLLAPELASGTRLNINRAFGNGRDDNNNGVVDEPGEFIDRNGNNVYDTGQNEETPVWNLASGNVAANSQFNGALFPVKATEIVPDADVATYPNGRIAEIDHRQLMARHLYVTALMLATDAQFGRPAPGGDPQADQQLARRVAQWAVNAIDFRDPDNIMTPFEYDVNPFDGWDPAVDGVPQETYPAAGNVQLVWGAERPELLISETASWHDRRTDDTIMEDPYPATDKASELDPDPLQPDKDKDFDQLTRPRGALFIELYNPWPGSPGVSADTHAVGAGPDATIPRVDQGVDLTKLASDGSPAWRLTMYKRGAIDDVVAAQWDPDSPDAAKRPSVPVDRTVYFTGQKPPARYPTTGVYSGGVPFFNRPANQVPPVRPGRYLVVGAGEDMGNGVYRSIIGDVKGARNPDNAASQRPKRRIELKTGNVADKVRFVDADDNVITDSTITPAASSFTLQSPADPGANVQAYRAYPGDNSASVTDVAIIDQSVDSTGAPVRRLLTISEPAKGYPDNFQGIRWNATKEQYEADGVVMPLDIPLDGPIGGEAVLDAMLRGEPRPSYLTDIDPVLTQIRDPSQPDDHGASYSQIYLQRLANPLLPWNPPQAPAPNITANGHNPNLPVNPYLTVDASSVNLTVFNSHGDDSGEEEDGTFADSPRDRFASHERGYTAEVTQAPGAPPNSNINLSSNNKMPSLWAEELPSGEQNRNAQRGPGLKETPQNKFFSNNNPQQRLSLKNSNDYWFKAIPFNTLGFANRSFHDQNLTGEQRKLQPQKPYEWANWNNRPYASGNELLFVPRGRSSELLRRFSSADVSGGPTPPEPYLSPTGEVSNTGQPTTDPQPAFAHLENFFYDEPAASAPRTVPRGMHRILDYIHTPSLFAGAENWLNPSSGPDPQGASPNGIGFGANLPAGQDLQNLVTGTAAEKAVVSAYATDPRLDYRPPFNSISEFRDPGRINLNTMSTHPVPGGATPRQSDVWRGIFHGATDSGASDVHFKRPILDFTQSRRGDAGTSPFALNAANPTFFGNPFRSADAGELVPIQSLVRGPIQTGLLRTEKPDEQAPVANSKPLFVNDNIGTGNQYRDSDRNAYFRYSPIARTANLTTTRSNVYAVWVTIGFFEVEDVPDWNTATPAQLNKANFNNDQALYNRVYPDGYTFTREDGVDVGNTRRLRGFYMIDRTKMAGFEPGADHNVENVIRLRRRIE